MIAPKTKKEYVTDNPTPKSGATALSVEELEQLVSEGEIKKYPNGDFRWQAGNSRSRQPGALAKRPKRAPQLFDSQTGLVSRQNQLEVDRMVQRQALIDAVSEVHELDADQVTFERARQLASGQLFREIFEADNLNTKISGFKYIDQLTGQAPAKTPLIDQRQINIEMDAKQQRVLIDHMNRNPRMFQRMGRITEEQADRIESGEEIIVIDAEVVDEAMEHREQ